MPLCLPSYPLSLRWFSILRLRRPRWSKEWKYFAPRHPNCVSDKHQPHRHKDICRIMGGCAKFRYAHKLFYSSCWWYKRYFSSSLGLCDVCHAAYGNTFSYISIRVSSTEEALNIGWFKKYFFQLRDIEFHFSGSCLEIPLIVSWTVILTPDRALIFLGIDQFLLPYPFSCIMLSDMVFSLL